MTLQTGGCPYRPPNRAENSCVNRAVVRGWLKEEEQKRPKVSVEKCFIQWVFNFKHLGALFQADGDTRHMMLVRAAIARSRRKLVRAISSDADDKNDDDSESRASRPKGGAGLGHKYNDSKWKPTTLNAV